MRQFTFLIFIITCLGISSLSAQLKYEKETRMNSEEAPKEALKFIERLEGTSKEKWYSEENLDGKAVEVKLKRNGDDYSIKFTTEGDLIDVERRIRWKQIPRETAEEIIEELYEEFDKVRWEKIQIQFIGDCDDILEFLNENDEEDDIDIYYEIEFQGKKEGSYSLYEYRFDDEGEIEKRSRILPRNTDNLEF